MKVSNMLGNAAKVLHRRQYLQGVTIFKQGDTANEAFLIESGSVEILLKNDDGQDRVLAVLGAGEIFGEMGLTKNPPERVATARAKEKTELVLISYDQLSDKLGQCDPLIRALFHMFIKRIDRLLNPADTD